MQLAHDLGLDPASPPLAVVEKLLKDHTKCKQVAALFPDRAKYLVWMLERLPGDPALIPLLALDKMMTQVISGLLKPALCS